MDGGPTEEQLQTDKAMTAKKSPSELPCLLPGQRPLCQILHEAGLPDDPRWMSLIHYMRSLEYNEALSLSQRASLQSLLLATLHDKDFSDAKFRTVMNLQERVVTAPYRRKLEAAEAETRALLADFESLLVRHTGKVQGLGEDAVGLVESGTPPADMVRRLRKSFRKVVKVMEDDARGLEEAARTDSLTGLANRRRLDEETQRATARAAMEDTPLALMICDVDQLREVNDRYGYDFGDKVITMVGGLIRSELEAAAVPDVLCARYGGDVFALLMPGFGVAGATVLAERLAAAVSGGRVDVPDDKIGSDGPLLGVTLSIGIAALDPDWGDVMAENLLKAADDALFKAKAEGCGRVKSC